MRLSAVSVSLAATFSASLSSAQYLINELSFGHTGRVTPADAYGTIPGFVVKGQPDKPQIYSNKIILTPVSPGNQRGSLWSEKSLSQSTWTADLEFRASGPERGGGNLNFWLANHGDTEVGESSIYTVGRFDGLALVIDTHGGSGGMVRGFLNDGTLDYSQHHNVDELAFGHCFYSYRNLGRPTAIKIVQARNSFRVDIDGNLCFETDKFSVPPGNKVGVTAATPDTPDSFEVFKVTVMTDTSQYSRSTYQQPPPEQNQQQNQQQQANSNTDNDKAGDSGVDNTPDEDPDIFTTSKTQFADLHNRLQASRSQLSSIHRTLSKQDVSAADRHTELKDLINTLKQELSKLDQLSEMQRRIDGVDREMRNMRNDWSKRMLANERTFEGNLKSHHETLSQAMADSVPGHGKLVFILIGSQVVLAVAYVMYKRRKQTDPKKYL